MNFLTRAQAIHPVVFIAVAVAWRFLLVFVFSSDITFQFPNQAVTPGFGFIANDYHYFIDPAEHFYKTGEYALQEGVPFAGRMPGYGIFYLLFRMLMSVESANLMMIVTQTILGGIGVYALARGSEIYYGKFTAFVIVFAIGFLYPVSAFFDYQTLAEGFAMNLMCISFLFIMRGLQKNPVKWFLLAGVLLAWTVFSRPYLGVLLPFFGLFVLFQSKAHYKKRLIHAVILGMPFTIALLAWNIRNYQQLDRIVLMETSTNESYGKTYSMAWLQIRNLIYVWGGEPAYFEPGSEAEWFRKDQTNSPLELPEKIYASGCFTESDLRELKSDFQKFHYSADYDTTLHNHIAQTAMEYRKCYVSQQTSLERVALTANVVKKATLRSGSSYLPMVVPNWLDKFLRLLFLGMYYILLIGWLLSTVLIPGSRWWIVPVVLLFVGILNVSSVIEHRYFLSIFPFVILGFTPIALNVVARFRTK